jgi:hypothetical protein
LLVFELLVLFLKPRQSGLHSTGLICLDTVTCRTEDIAVQKLNGLYNKDITYDSFFYLMNNVLKEQFEDWLPSHCEIVIDRNKQENMYTYPWPQ